MKEEEGFGLPSASVSVREGELYRVVNTFGSTFELRYGYYDDRDRENPLCGPTVIYPDFLKTPIYTDTGHPFITMMQDACTHFRGKERTEDTTCAECAYFERGEEWFGICTCPTRKKKETTPERKRRNL